MKPLSNLLVLAAGAFAAAFPASDLAAQPRVADDLPEAPRIEAHWFDGAEIARYELSQSRYGAERPGHAELIFVTEPFLPEAQVKRDYGDKDAVWVLKLNALRTFNTGIYSYRTMRSIFTPTGGSSYPHALKANLTQQDWCGQIYHQLNRRRGRLEGELRSYFQREGDRDYALEGDVWAEDELWTLLRLDPEALPTGSFRMLPGLLFQRFAHKLPEPAEARAKLIDTVEGRRAYVIVYPKLGRELIIFFKADFPRVITGWRERTGPDEPYTTARLAHLKSKVYYWEQNRPEDSERRRELGLQPIPR